MARSADSGAPAKSRRGSAVRPVPVASVRGNTARGSGAAHETTDQTSMSGTPRCTNTKGKQAIVQRVPLRKLRARAMRPDRVAHRAIRQSRWQKTAEPVPVEPPPMALTNSSSSRAHRSATGRAEAAKTPQHPFAHDVGKHHQHHGVGASGAIHAEDFPSATARAKAPQWIGAPRQCRAPRRKPALLPTSSHKTENPKHRAA